MFGWNSMTPQIVHHAILPTYLQDTLLGYTVLIMTAGEWYLKGPVDHDKDAVGNGMRQCMLLRCRGISWGKTDCSCL